MHNVFILFTFNCSVLSYEIPFANYERQRKTRKKVEYDRIITCAAANK